MMKLATQTRPLAHDGVNHLEPEFVDDTRTRVDMHLHSIASGAATNWWVKHLGLGAEANESYTSPEDAFSLVKDAGMQFATLTDHETIEGGRTLTHQPDFFLGEEVNARFPEDGSTVDVLVYGLTEMDHPELQSRRPDVYRLVDYLRERGLVFALAHPMFETEVPLDRPMIEKRMVLFGLWEFINGSRPAIQNRLATELALGVDAITLRQLAVNHGLTVPPHQRISGIAGSDDHGGAYPGSTWTETSRVSSTAEYLDALRAGECWPGGEDGSPSKMVHTGFRLAALARANDPTAASVPRTPLLDYLPLLAVLPRDELRRGIAKRYENRVREALQDESGRFSLPNLLTKLGSLIEAHLFLAPYLGVQTYFGKERRSTLRLRDDMGCPAAGPVRVGVFVDDLNAVHGVSTMYRNMATIDAAPHGVSLHLVRLGHPEDDAPLRPIVSVPLPFDQHRVLEVPSLLDIVDLIAEQQFDVLHIATPGPLGICALVAAHVVGLPVVGAYHTEFGEYARQLSGDDALGSVVNLAVRAFYERCSVLVASSGHAVKSLRHRGYRTQQIEVLRNGVDAELFNPGRRDQALHDQLGEGRKLLLYTGRISKEKGLRRLAMGYLALRRKRDDVQLVMIGDGPLRPELEELLGDTAVFTGFLQGEDLARTVASCDIFTFPSLTDTLGRVVIEAQACGLPAVVFDKGGQLECIQPGLSGLAASSDDLAAFFGHINTLLDDPGLRATMGANATAHASSLSWEQVVAGLSELYRDLAGPRGIGAEPPIYVAPEPVLLA